MYTYYEKYGRNGNGSDKNYCVYILPDGGEAAWYEEDQFKLLGSDRFDLLPENHVDRINWQNKKVREA
jgi:hypothetical protein